MNHAPRPVAPLESEVVQVGDAVGQRAQRSGLFEGAVRPVGEAGNPGEWRPVTAISAGILSRKNTGQPACARSLLSGRSPRSSRARGGFLR
jgi:hypothetical protein